MNTPTKPTTYEQRVRQLEDEGLTTSDAQGVADVEVLKAHDNARLVAANLAMLRALEFVLADGNTELDYEARLIIQDAVDRANGKT